MQHPPTLESILATSYKPSKTPNFRNPSVLQISPTFKEFRPSRQNLTVKNRPENSRSFTRSFHISKFSIGDGEDTSIHQRSTSKNSISPTKDHLTALDGNISRGTSDIPDKNFRVRRKNLMTLKTTPTGDTDFSLNKSITQPETTMTEQDSAGMFGLHQNAHFVKQREYIKTNPHFNKFNRSLYALDKLETEKVPLSKETFYYPDQLKLIERASKDKIIQERDTSFSSQTYILKENKKEEIDIPEGKTIYLKINAQGKILPLKVKIELKFGFYEVFVSKKREKPSFGDCDFYFTSNQFDVDYGDLNEEINYVYFGLTSPQKSKITILCTFLGKAKPKKVLETQNTISKEKLMSRSKSRGAYEFINGNIPPEQLNEFVQSIAIIKAEKKRKNLLLAHGKNWLVENREIASEYNKLKEVQIQNLNKRWEMNRQKSKESRELLEVEKKKKLFLDFIKSELIKLEAEEKEKRIKKKKEKHLYEASWMVITTLFGLVNEICQKKRTMVALNIFKRMKEMTAIQIQKKMRQMLYAPKIIQSFGQNRAVTSVSESRELSTRHQIHLYHGLNCLALMIRESKKEKTEPVLASLMQDLFVPLKIVAAIDRYVGNMRKIQKQWKTKKVIFNAKVLAFFKAWNKYAVTVVEEEVNIKKKKYSLVIPLIKEFHLIKYAKSHIKDKLRTYLKAAQAASEKAANEKNFKSTESSTRNMPKFPDEQKKKEIQKEPNNSKDANIELAFEMDKIKEDGSKNENQLNSERNESNRLFKMVNILIKPNQDELRAILDKLVQEIKESSGLKGLM